jgi:tetratricopeptide (TPR) repeat protein
MRDGGDPHYSLQLLLSCCKLDPGCLLYRRTLREVGRSAAGGKKGGWLESLANLPARGRFKSARSAGDHRKALEHGEDLLSRNPDDLAVQLDLADSAEALGLHAIAAWMLEEACHNAPGDVPALRALAALYERQNRLRNAIVVWEQIRKAAPSDPEAGQKIMDLSASDTIARGNFKR